MDWMGQTQHKRMVLESRLAIVAEVQETVGEALMACGHSDDACFAVRLALDEALANAIRHGNGGDPAKHVVVSYQITADRVEISICDEGGGFVPATVPDPTLPQNLCKPNGRGIMLMRAYMSSVQYNDDGNCVKLVMGPDRLAVERR